MATEFHNLINSIGGGGDKECALASTNRAAVEASRNEQRGILTARFMGLVSINKCKTGVRVDFFKLRQGLNCSATKVDSDPCFGIQPACPPH